MSTSPTGRPHPAPVYEVRLLGRLDPRWATRFPGMTFASEDGTTVLVGELVDQAALHGLLHQLRDTGLPLVSVTRVVADATTHPPVPTEIRAPGA